ncbi:MAG TPA: RNA 2',3'-cyclic phosphodiesterase [Candidatus Acidoferrum sp.]|nr:RNA 2',3'-cyclic phosphodiesterase [Candidatus Acidoferrum sp.]
MRLFVALSLSSEARDNLASLLGEFQRAQPEIRWNTPDKLHVTLKFIGHVTADKLPAIQNALAGIVAPPSFHLNFRGIGFFPTERRPVVIWAGIAAPPALALLSDQTDAALSPCGIQRNVHPFQPHLTLARLKDTPLNDASRALVRCRQDDSFGTLYVNQFDLIESKLKSSGAEYTTLRSFPLADQGKNQ